MVEWAFIHVILVIFCVFKLLYFTRMSKDFSFLIILIQRIQKETFTFFSFYLIFIMTFALLFNITGVYLVADLESDYPGVHWYIAACIQVFRNSICDINPPDYSYWIENGKVTHSLMVGWAWFLFFFTEFYLMINLLNFVIADMMDTY